MVERQPVPRSPNEGDPRLVPIRFVEVTFLVESVDNGSQFFSTCPDIGTSTYGRTRKEAISNLRLGVLLTFASRREEGREAEFLQAKNITVKTENVHKPKSIEAIGNNRFKLPIDTAQDPSPRTLARELAAAAKNHPLQS